MIKRYDFSGSPKEIGRQHGESMKKEIHELYNKLLYFYTDYSPS